MPAEVASRSAGGSYVANRSPVQRRAGNDPGSGPDGSSSVVARSGLDAYRRFAEAAGREAPSPDPGANPSDLARVTWQEAVDYAGWLARRTGQAYRLPTEAEWESAARAGC